MMTARELYEALACRPGLHSLPELYDNTLVWLLYKDAYLQVSCDNGKVDLQIISNSLLRGSLIRWYPEERDVLDTLYAVGKKGNMLVLKKSLFETAVFYLGTPEEFPLSEKQPIYFGKKRGEDYRLIYLEQN